MKSFLGNLINRHLETSDDHQGDAYKVQPRPKARFENERVTPSFQDNDPSNLYEITQATEPYSEVGSRRLPQFSDEMDATITDISDSPSKSSISKKQKSRVQSNKVQAGSQPFDDLNNRIRDLSIQLNQQQTGEEESGDLLDTQHAERAETMPNVNGRAEQSVGNDLTLESGINNHLQEILERLQNSHTTNTVNQGELDQLTPSMSANSTHKEATTPDQISMSSAVIPKGKHRSVKPNAQTDNNPSNKRASKEAGLLQTPGWLTRIQEDLNSRWQQYNKQTKPEPVVNVTIGRIEIKAVQAATATQPKTGKKPRGVMSLDSYLKQRENRGGA